MASYDEIKLEDIIHGGLATYNPNTGSNKNADSLPVLIVYEEGSSTPMSVATSVTNMASGRYRWQCSVEAASGFEQGKFYEIWVSGSVTGTDTVTQVTPITAFKATNRVVDDLATQVSINALNNISESGIRVAIGMASANLDTQLNAIALATNAGDLASKVADTGIIITGSVISGTYTTTHSDDEVFWITAPVTPAISGFGLRQTLEFYMPSGRIPTQLQLNGYWNGTGASANIFAYNTRNGIYDQLTHTGNNMASRTTELIYGITLPRDYVEISGAYSVMRAELRSTSVNTAHRLRIDRALVYHVDEEAPFTMTSPTVDDIWSAPTRTLTSPGVDPSTPPTISEIASGVWENILANHTGVVGGAAAALSDALADTSELQNDWTDGGRLDNILDSRASQSGLEARTLPSGDYFNVISDSVLVSGITPIQLGDLRTNVISIKAKTDNLVFSTANQLDVSVHSVTSGGFDDIFQTYRLTESYPATGVAPTPAQSMMMSQQVFTNFEIVGTTISVFGIDNTTVVAEWLMDSSGSPTRRVRSL